MMDCATSLQSTLQNKAISVNSATPTVICIVLNKQHWSHKCGCQYIQYNSAPYTHHKLRRWSASGNTTHALLPHPLPHLACHNRANSCSMRIPPVHVIITLLAGWQSAILSSNEWHNHMNPAFISTIMAPNFEIRGITSGTRRSIPIPNQNIC